MTDERDPRAGQAAGPPGGGAPTLDPRHVGLLTQVMSNTLDEDYLTVAKRRDEGAAGRDGERAGASKRVALIAALTAFGLLIGISALRTEQDRPRAAAERAELVSQVRARQSRLDDLQGRLGTTKREVANLQKQVAQGATSGQQLSSRLEALSLASGALAVTGPGVTITVDDAPAKTNRRGGVILDRDLQALVNALWEAGAEAVSVDGHRLTALTAIRFAGRAITVDYRSLAPPYVIDAVGDPDTLPARLLETAGGQAWLSLKSNFGIRFDTVPRDKVTVPADPHEHLLYARPGDR